jgi:hypothetical protein
MPQALTIQVRDIVDQGLPNTNIEKAYGPRFKQWPWPLKCAQEQKAKEGTDILLSKNELIY